MGRACYLILIQALVACQSTSPATREAASPAEAATPNEEAAGPRESLSGEAPRVEQHPGLPAVGGASAEAASKGDRSPRIVHAEKMAASQGFDLLDAAPHRALGVDVGEGVVLEVLDWGGSGAPIVLLAGLGNSAHIFDDLAPGLVEHGRVLGVSRRGFGASTVPSTGYDIPTLGRDIVRVVESLGLSRAAFVGHSIASEELNWLGSEHPELVRGLVYVDAAYDRVAMRAPENRPKPRPEPTPTPEDLASPVAYAAFMSRMMEMPIPLDEVLATFRFGADGHYVGTAPDASVPRQILEGVSVPDYSRLRVPILALFAVNADSSNPFTAFAARERERFARALPAARVVAIPNSRHYLFFSHREEVLRELGAFLASLEGAAAPR